MSATISATTACDTDQERLISILSLLRQKTPVSMDVIAEYIALAGDARNLVGLDRQTLEVVSDATRAAEAILQRGEKLAQLLALIPDDGNVDDVDDGAEFLRLADDADLIRRLPHEEFAAVRKKAETVRKHVILY